MELLVCLTTARCAPADITTSSGPVPRGVSPAALVRSAPQLFRPRTLVTIITLFTHQGLHSCNTRCCPNTPTSHACIKPCGKLLSCGQHVCPRFCHAGACGPCDVLLGNVCQCGKTTYSRPLLCGQTAPPCPHPCARSRPFCEHKCPRSCHEGECAPCALSGERR